MIGCDRLRTKVTVEGMHPDRQSGHTLIAAASAICIMDFGTGNTDI
jgi:hypothetical protein